VRVGERRPCDVATKALMVGDLQPGMHGKSVDLGGAKMDRLEARAYRLIDIADPFS
jgi:hypothetical protein